jgi:hypothetical protein
MGVKRKPTVVFSPSKSMSRRSEARDADYLLALYARLWQANPVQAETYTRLVLLPWMPGLKKTERVSEVAWLMGVAPATVRSNLRHAYTHLESYGVLTRGAQWGVVFGDLRQLGTEHRVMETAVGAKDRTARRHLLDEYLLSLLDETALGEDSRIDAFLDSGFRERILYPRTAGVIEKHIERKAQFERRLSTRGRRKERPDWQTHRLLGRDPKNFP